MPTVTDCKTERFIPRESQNILIVNDDASAARLLLEVSAKKGVHADLASDKKTAVDFLDKNSYNLVFTGEQLRPGPDLPLKDRAGFELLSHIKNSRPQVPVIMIQNSPVDNDLFRQAIETAVQAIMSGCSDFLTTPTDRKKIEAILETYLPCNPVSSYATVTENGKVLYSIVGKSAKLSHTITLAKKIAPTSAPVLISGESGTGKELISQLIHQQSSRCSGPYIRVNCAALSDSLLESELFGHEKGAFTGAYVQRKGRFELADGGTLLLDEISETPLHFQAKLLRILEQQCFERVGGNDNVDVDVRIISTTNRELASLVREGKFRQDLYYRISGLRLIIPPLRERLDDLDDLTWHFVNQFAAQTKRNITKLDPAMMNIFENYHWPGNIRQLRNVVITSLVFGTGRVLSLADVSWLFDELQPLAQQNGFVSPTEQQGPEDNFSQTTSLAGMPLANVEKIAILDTLRQTAGNQSRAAKILGISDRTLREKIRKYRSEECLQCT